MVDDQLKYRLSQLCNPEVVRKKMLKEFEELLKQTDIWLRSPPLELHVELLILDAQTEPRPLDEQVKRLNIALIFLISIFAKTVAENNGELLKLLLEK